MIKSCCTVGCLSGQVENGRDGLGKAGEIIREGLQEGLEVELKNASSELARSSERKLVTNSLVANRQLINLESELW